MFILASRESCWRWWNKVGESFHHLKDVVTNEDVWDVTEVLAHGVGLLRTDSKINLSTCTCEAADESL